MFPGKFTTNVRAILLGLPFVLIMFFLPCKFVLANGNCTGPSGGTNNLTAALGNINVTNPSDNAAGKVIASAYSWSLPGYVENCSCTSGNHEWYWTTTTQLASAGGDNWFVYSDYLDVRLWIQDPNWSGGKMAVPFSNAFTLPAANTCNQNLNYGSNATGSHGVLDLRIRKPFIGTVMLPTYTLASLYSCLATDKTCNAQGAPTINYSLSGTVTVPQNCTIDAGQIVTIDFGNIWSGKFKSKGEKPDGVNPVTKQIKVQCNSGVEAMANLTVRFQSTPDANYPDAISSDNPDVGVVVTDSNDKVIEPNTGLIPFSLENSQATVSFKAYPVSTTGKAPTEGKFTSLAYIRVDFA
ncbi:fimbrial protein [Enterobacter cloacae complex sp. Mu1197]|uniref:Fimbrial protein n=1 Tax=Enterobacter cloacae complex sp. Mu1197 TaxID=3152302 RepID=A0AAU7FVD5_9ENTR